MIRYPRETDRPSAFLRDVRAAERRLFPTELHAHHPARMRSSVRTWRYSPSHHAATGLVTAADLTRLSAPGRRLLSLGAHPACFERVLCALGLPEEHLLVADSDPEIRTQPLPAVQFDLLDAWPDIGRFDLIIFPESLCMAIRGRLRRTAPHGAGPFASDAAESRLLAGVCKEALSRLKEGGEVRANGPQSHPNIVAGARAQLEREGTPHVLRHLRYFLRVGHPPPMGPLSGGRT